MSARAPGGPWPDLSVAHTYRTPGTRQVWVSTRWQCEFSVDGRGPFPVPGQVTMTSEPITVPVREAHAELVATP